MFLCHTGLENAEVIWIDESRNNKNSISGQLPDGVYDNEKPPYTKIEYCCRTDGYATNAIYLPTDSPFVLLKSNTHLCQKVKGMQVTSEYFRWDNEDRPILYTNEPMSLPLEAGAEYAGAVTGAVNAEKSDRGDIKIHYCYYHK